MVNWPKRGVMEITGTQAWNDSRARRDNATQVLIVTRRSTRLHVETSLGSEIGNAHNINSLHC